MTDVQQYQENFLKAAYQVMDDLRMTNRRQFAEWIGLSKATIQKIMYDTQAPTMQHGIILCRKAGIDANWLFLNKGTFKLNIALPEKQKSIP